VGFGLRQGNRCNQFNSVVELVDLVHSNVSRYLFANN